MLNKILMALITTVMLSGCVVGQHIEMDYTAEKTSFKTEKNTVAVKVVDERPYVLDGDKEPWYIGHYRAGFGNPWDVTTENKVPLAEVLADDIREELAAQGFSSQSPSTNRTLSVEIKDWNFDAYTNGKFWFDLDIKVFDENGLEIARNTVKQSNVIEGSFWTGAKSSFEREMPKLYKQAVQSIVPNNEEIMPALRN